MAFLPSLSHDELHKFHQVVTRAAEVRSHFDALVWLQGDMQLYFPHAILVAAWGDFESGTLNHDIVSPLVGVRSHNSCPDAIKPLLLQMFKRWTEFGNKPFAINAGANGFELDNTTASSSNVRDAMKKMRCAMVHGIKDERGNQDCLYIAFSDINAYSQGQRSAMTMVLPYIDTTLRQVTLMPHQSQLRSLPNEPAGPTPESCLSEREEEVLQWVALGKTNPEIGSILTISAFTVKNHLKNIFKKLNVSNRAQAVGKVTTLASYV